MTAPIPEPESKIDILSAQIPQLLHAVSAVIDALFRQAMREKPRSGDLALMLSASLLCQTHERVRKGR
jgi:hypothetical protein